MQTAFYKFIELKYCTTEEYLLAKKYMSEANENEKRCFYDACFSIILQVIRKMYQKKYPDFKIGANIYTKFGLNDEEFYQYYLLYINEYMSEENKNLYVLCYKS